MKRLRIAMVKILKSSLGIVRHLVISIGDYTFKKIIMTDSIKIAALMLLVTIRNTWTQLLKVQHH
jgi:energy-converting hydrogenase Eha subunit G